MFLADAPNLVFVFLVPASGLVAVVAVSFAAYLGLRSTFTRRRS
jgi:hypothetical protein